MKILIIEDDKWWADNTTQVLESLGHQTFVSPHALGAIQAIDDFHPDALVLDMMLTGETGMALLHELQTYHDTAEIPVILVSSLDGLSLDNLKPYGVRRILNKATMEPSDLIAAVGSL